MVQIDDPTFLSLSMSHGHIRFAKLFQHGAAYEASDQTDVVSTQGDYRQTQAAPAMIMSRGGQHAQPVGEDQDQNNRQPKAWCRNAQQRNSGGKMVCRLPEMSGSHNAQGHCNQNGED